MEVAGLEDAQEVSLPTETSVVAKEGEETEIAPEFLIKHPLQNVWKLWYYEGHKNKNWEENLKYITSFDTVEDFWSIYHHIKQASEINQGCDYNVFKEAIAPKWEHPANHNGGRWLIVLERKHRYSDLDRVWLDICLCLIGEGFENNDDVCGAVLNVRNKQYKVAVWLRDYSRNAAVLEIGRKIKEKLKLGPKFQIVFQTHKDTEKSSSSTKSKYVL